MRISELRSWKRSAGMPTKSLTNLLKAGGLATPVAADTFKTDMPTAPLPAGRSFKDYLLTSLSLVSKSFVSTPTTPMLSYTTITWNLARNVAGATNKLQDLGPRVTTLTFSNVVKDDGSSSAGNVYHYSLTVNYTTTDIQITAQIASARSVAAFGAPGSGNAYESFTITVTHKPDNDLFNDPGISFYDDVQVRPLITGQGSPASAPAAPTWTTTFPTGAGNEFVRFTAIVGWEAGITEWETRFSPVSDFSSGVTTSNSSSGPPAALVYVNGASGSFFGDQTLYAQSRVTQPYTTPWSSTTTMTWSDTRPP